jgi:RNA polymerase sigma-70 factor, ECF subfamily
LHLEVVAGERSDEAVQRNDLRDRLLDALSRLREAERDVVLLHDVEGLLHAEIAEHLSMSVLMSRRHLSDGRKKLRDILGDYDTLEPDHD